MGNLAWGLQITALGMGLVLGLLALLWGLLALAARLDHEPAPEPEASAAPTPADAPADPLADPALRVAVTMAVLAHAAQQRGEAAPPVRLHLPGSLLHASRWVAAGRARQNHAWRRPR